MHPKPSYAHERQQRQDGNQGRRGYQLDGSNTGDLLTWTQNRKTRIPAASNRLERSRRDLEDFFENGAVGLHWVASDGSILRVNQAELDLLGYTREEYVGRHISDFHADRPVIDDILTRLGKGEKLDKYEARLRAKDGSIKHVLISSNVNFRDGKFVNTRCFTLDVTELKETETALRESDQRLRATHDRAFAGIAEVTGRTISASECAVLLAYGLYGGRAATLHLRGHHSP